MTYVDFLIVIAKTLPSKLRRDVQCSANVRREVAFSVWFTIAGLFHLALDDQGSQTEISNLRIPRKVDKDVLRLQVSMDYTKTMDVGKTLKNLPEKFPGFFETEALADTIPQCLERSATQSAICA